LQRAAQVGPKSDFQPDRSFRNGQSQPSPVMRGGCGRVVIKTEVPAQSGVEKGCYPLWNKGFRRICAAFAAPPA
jgi:hypothetical protein